MCRWAAWIGAPIFIGDLVTVPSHSLVAQSRAADQCKTATNADGFGLAWYGHRPEPGLYRDVYPAWSDPNLDAIARQVQSGLFMAHVRASTGTATSRNNCHPFVCDRWSFMHNGQVGGFDAIRKHADMAIPDGLYEHRKGATDSEALFLLACGHGLDRDPAAALRAAVATFETLAHQTGQHPHLRMTAALSDGESLFAVRYASDAHAPSLWYQRSDIQEGWAVVSEPLEHANDWIEVPQNSFCTFTRDAVMVERFQMRHAA